jgi:hypothetical protein
MRGHLEGICTIAVALAATAAAAQEPDAELLTRIYMDGRQRRIYTVAQTRTREPRRLWTDPRPAHVDTPVLLQ